jgi:hypothetical protein
MRLYKLRDKTRHFAIDNKLDKSEWIFEYLDKTLSRTISQLDKLHIGITVFLYQKYKRTADFNNFKLTVSNTLKSNPLAKEIYDEYMNLLVTYFYKKHFIARRAVKWLISLIGFVLGKISRLKRASKNVFQFTYLDFIRIPPVRLAYKKMRSSTYAIPMLPETSAMRQFSEKPVA